MCCPPPTLVTFPDTLSGTQVIPWSLINIANTTYPGNNDDEEKKAKKTPSNIYRVVLWGFLFLPLLPLENTPGFPSPLRIIPGTVKHNLLTRQLYSVLKWIRMIVVNWRERPQLSLFFTSTLNFLYPFSSHCQTINLSADEVMKAIGRLFWAEAKAQERSGST